LIRAFVTAQTDVALVGLAVTIVVTAVALFVGSWMDGGARVVAISSAQRCSLDGSATQRSVGVGFTILIAVGVGVPVHLACVVVDFAVTIVVDVVADLRVIDEAARIVILAVRTAVSLTVFVLVTAGVADLPVEVHVEAAIGRWIAVFVMLGIGECAQLDVSGIALRVAVVAVISQGLTRRSETCRVIVSVGVVVGRLKDARVLCVGTAIDGALDAIVAARQASRPTVSTFAPFTTVAVGAVVALLVEFAFVAQLSAGAAETRRDAICVRASRAKSEAEYSDPPNLHPNPSHPDLLNSAIPMPQIEPAFRLL
jgi:hypothetical protein